ncbi:plastocyanin/azurin family copper-binding protein [Coraliomargarita algicola]|uniref:Plastocyanin/azurin family copper-binding protein n=1 Tax=Coraliomargarita algicola TaxID=3092156 RepID=A0ABZ0RKE2_9BACT|nr:plastocyanin/azurin family copper-binding protein [Coraliomargarita sp. J2-16]WPJ96675.1 plastocyanin/azurin family copper-binding protein [Coraliomargarita sp. J2-16]
MRLTFSLLVLPLIFTGCGDATSDHSEHTQHDHNAAGAVPAGVTDPANPVSVVDGVTVIEMTGNDRMKFNLESFTVPAGSPVRLTFTNVGRMPKAAMGHNVVFLTAEADAAAFATAAAAARDQDYIPADFSQQIVAHTQLLGPGESDTIEFTAPEEPGDYEYLCSFPAHMYAGMRGVMTVESP